MNIIRTIGIGQPVSRRHLTSNQLRVIFNQYGDCLCIYSQFRERILSDKLSSCEQTYYTTSNDSCVTVVLSMRKFDGFDGTSGGQRHSCSSMPIVMYNCFSFDNFFFEEIASFSVGSHLSIIGDWCLLKYIWDFHLIFHL